MKSPFLTLALVLFFAACSSPGKKKSGGESASKKDTTLVESTGDRKSGVPPIFEDSNMSIPPYGLDTVIALMSKIEAKDDTSGMDGSIEALDYYVYSSLSLEQKFTYNMLNPENSAQNCDILPEQTDPEHRIFGKLQDAFGEWFWSDRQLNFFKDYHAEVVKLMKATIDRDKKVGNNFKDVIIEMNATDMIPYLIDVYNRKKKDHYILTVLIELMENNKYPEFINSISHRKLFGKDEYSLNAPYLVYNQANEDLIIKRAMNFYNGLSSK